MSAVFMSRKDHGKPSEDIEFTEITGLDWAPDKAEASVRALAELAISHARTAISWYLHRKIGERRGARITRLAAIIFVMIAGLVPLIGEIFQIKETPWINPLWSSVALVLAASSVGLDQFFGFSSGYMRYLMAEMQLQRISHDFVIEFQAKAAARAGQQPDQKQIREAIDACKQFLLGVHTVVQSETASWSQEFKAALAEIDKSARANAAAVEGGAVNVTITNGESCVDGWTLTVDGGSPLRRTGKTIALKDLTPGIHILTASGNIEGKEKRAEWSVSVKASAQVDTEAVLA